jgi:hypothetical protein
MEILSYPYRPRPGIMLLGCVFFGAIALLMSRQAMTNDRGLIINGLIRLEPGGATNFYWGLAALSAAFVAVALPAFFVGLLSSHRVVLTSTDISAPKYGFSRKPTVVNLSDIRGQSMQIVQGHRLLNIYHVNGKLTITESFLPNKAAFEELCTAIAQRTQTQPQG